jgi:hypothetical protein
MSGMFSAKQTKFYLAITLIICLIGLFLRAYFFAMGRSLWLDEAMLALNIVKRSFLDLFRPLDFNQGAPIGFLLLLKTVSNLFGCSDYTLRIIPFIVGLASIPVMCLVSEQFVGKPYALISLGLFSISPKLIYYSSELKQYGTDVLTALIILWAALKCLDYKANLRTLVVFGIVGSIAIWMSHPSLFVFGGACLTMGLTFTLKRDSRRLLWLICVGVVYIIDVALIYFINLRHLASNKHLISYWSSSFAPLPPWSNFSWYYYALIGMLRNPATLPISVIVGVLLIVGAFSFVLRGWQLMLILIAPFLLTLIASALKKYPFGDRLLLFLLPILFLLLAEGTKIVRTILLKMNRYLADITCISLVVYLLYNPITIVYSNLQNPPLGEHIKPVMEYLSENRLVTDLIYVYYGAIPAFEFYRPFYGFNEREYIKGISSREEPAKYIEDIKKLKGNRVWFVFSHNCSWCIVNEQEYILDYLNKTGIKVDEFLSGGASLYLYDLRHAP